MIFKTRLGWAGLLVSDKGICRIVLPMRDKKAVERELRNAACGVRSAEANSSSNPLILKKAAQLLREYFTGKRVSFDLSLDLSYYTNFQRLVWKAARAIPYGETQSYAWIARRIGRPNAARAVGNALGANPVPIITP